MRGWSRDHRAAVPRAARAFFLHRGTRCDRIRRPSRFPARSRPHGVHRSATGRLRARQHDDPCPATTPTCCRLSVVRHPVRHHQNLPAVAYRLTTAALPKLSGHPIPTDRSNRIGHSNRSSRDRLHPTGRSDPYGRPSLSVRPIPSDHGSRIHRWVPSGYSNRIDRLCLSVHRNRSGHGSRSDPSSRRPFPTSGLPSTDLCRSLATRDRSRGRSCRHLLVCRSRLLLSGAGSNPGRCALSARNLFC